ncbi:hypothetical protein Tco_0865188, partial [Tanacetum coccineum]
NNICRVSEWATFKGSNISGAVAVNNLGKWKTTRQMTSLTILLAVRYQWMAPKVLQPGSGYDFNM